MTRILGLSSRKFRCWHVETHSFYWLNWIFQWTYLCFVSSHDTIEKEIVEWRPGRGERVNHTVSTGKECGQAEGPGWAEILRWRHSWCICKRARRPPELSGEAKGSVGEQLRNPQWQVVLSLRGYCKESATPNEKGRLCSILEQHLVGTESLVATVLFRSSCRDSTERGRAG